MTYELCLEYGTYPLTVKDPFLGQDQELPDVFQKDQKLVDMLDLINDLFHELFLTIECQFHYIGHEFPEKRAKIVSLYQEIVEYLKEHFSDQDIIFHSLLIH